ncbi:hypothetical protein LAZ67_14000890 [Cordylochernes scorpioides]|uniref:Uncharacterized protein n=1 Tax=Cordylochernes scorpioides TaxID=51811 RepID=A0ABY6L5X4_9ARAC|nr:hypothetical protein LAZ67_14000890 [Cordylochernes scorpioides]
MMIPGDEEENQNIWACCLTIRMAEGIAEGVYRASSVMPRKGRGRFTPLTARRASSVMPRKGRGRFTPLTARRDRTPNEVIAHQRRTLNEVISHQRRMLNEVISHQRRTLNEVDWSTSRADFVRLLLPYPPKIVDQNGVLKIHREVAWGK